MNRRKKIFDGIYNMRRFNTHTQFPLRKRDDVDISHLKKVSETLKEKCDTLNREKVEIMSEFMEASKMMAVEHDNNIQRIQFELSETVDENKTLAAENLDLNNELKKMSEKILELEAENHRLSQEVIAIHRDPINTAQELSGRKAPSIPTVKISSSRSLLKSRTRLTGGKSLKNTIPSGNTE